MLAGTADRERNSETAGNEKKMVGAVRFELTTSCTPSKRAYQATLRPDLTPPDSHQRERNSRSRPIEFNYFSPWLHAHLACSNGEASIRGLEIIARLSYLLR